MLKDGFFDQFLVFRTTNLSECPQPVRNHFRVGEVPKYVVQQLGAAPKRESGICKLLTETTIKSLQTCLNLNKQPFEALHYAVRYILVGDTSNWEQTTTFAFVDQVRAHLAKWDSYSQTSKTSCLVVDEVHRTIKLLRTTPTTELMCVVLTRSESRYAML